MLQDVLVVMQLPTNIILVHVVTACTSLSQIHIPSCICLEALSLGEQSEPHMDEFSDCMYTVCMSV